MSLVLLAVTAALVPQVFATYSTQAPNLVCETVYGKYAAKGPIPTTTTTSFVQSSAVQVTTTTIPVTTVIGPLVISTVTDTDTETTTTTLPTGTSTFSTTTTQVTTTTDSTLITSTVTSTSIVLTTSTPVSTVGTSAGFLPIDDTVNSSEYPSRKNKYRPRRGSSDMSHSDSGKHNDQQDQQYPQSVICKTIADADTQRTDTRTPGAVIEYVDSTNTTTTVTGSTQTSTIPGSTTVQIDTTTTTAVSTVVPANVLTTVSITSTSTSSTTFIIGTTTTTVTQTSTSTVVAPESTYYAACASDNQVGPNYLGFPIDDDSGDDYDFVATDSAYDCCVLCQQTPGCAGTFYGPPDSQCCPGECALFENNVCANQDFGIGFLTNTDASGARLGPFIVGNGNCGFFYFDGSY